MANLTTKYNHGDIVYSPGCEYRDVWTVCPDCKGELKWMITFADGRQEECPCQTCTRSWEGPIGKLSHSEYVPGVRLLTIGQVRYDDDGPRYMCEETGIGSGTVHREADLFENRADADVAAQKKYIEQMAHIASLNFKKKGEFAKFTQTFGFVRAQALEKERELRRWIALIKGEAA